MNTPKLSHHSLRKYHRTLLEAKMPESYVKKLQGKATDPYIRPEETGELTEAYIEHYDALRVFREKQKIEELETQLEHEQKARYSLEDRLRFVEHRLDVKETMEKYKQRTGEKEE